MNPNEYPVSWMRDRSGFVFLEHAKVHVKDSSLEVSTGDGKRAQLPVTQLVSLYLGPGCSITTDAMDLLATTGTGVVWCRGGAIRMVGHAKPTAHTGRPAMAQAYKWANPVEHLTVVHRMYAIRFGDEFSNDEDDLDVLRGKEGSRVKRAYHQLAEEHSVVWTKRTSQIPHEDCDRINRCLNTTHHIMDGVAHSIIVGMGMLPQLGFIHTDSAIAFVLDISDLYKVRVADPVAFRVCSNLEKVPDAYVEREVRQEMRKELLAHDVYSEMTHHLRTLIGSPEDGFRTPTTYWNP